MFWIFILVVAVILLINLPMSALIVISVAIFCSTVSVVIVSQRLIGKVSYENAFKANVLGTLSFFFVLIFFSMGNQTNIAALVSAIILAIFVMLFVYSKQLGSTLFQSFIIILLSGLANACCIWVFESSMNLGLKITGGV